MRMQKIKSNADMNLIIELTPHKEQDSSTSSNDSNFSIMSSFKSMLGCIILLSSIMGGSSIGVMNNFIPVKSPFAKNAWRNGLVCFYFIIPAIIENYKLRKSINYSNLLTFRRYQVIILSLCMQVLWVFGLTFASSRTI
jgi:hypothetical protein